MSKKGTAKGGSAKSGRGSSSGKAGRGSKSAIPCRPGGNWPAKNGNKSGRGRGNAAPKK